jgi:hypothetical protein
MTFHDGAREGANPQLGSSLLVVNVDAVAGENGNPPHFHGVDSKGNRVDVHHDYSK